MLQLAVFDLDYCTWAPEMYQIQGPPILTPIASLEKKKRKKRSTPAIITNVSSTIYKGKTVTDRCGTPITVFDGASHALSEINQFKRQQSILAAVASSTDEPAWARQCMEWLTIEDGSTLQSSFDLVEIRFGDKKWHFESLQRKTGIAFDEMCFFDDTHSNILSVAELGVKCIHTPKGMTREAWNQALDMF